MTPFTLARLNLLRRPMTTIIALAAIAVSVAFSGMLLRLYRLSSERFSKLGRGGEAIVGAKAGNVDILLGALNMEGDYPGFLPFTLYASLKQRRGVRFEDGEETTPNFLRAVIPLTYYANYGPYRVLATDESFLRRPDPQDSLEFSAGRWANAEEEVVLGSEVALREHVKVDDPLVLRTATGDAEPPADFRVRVVGILAPSASAWDRGLYGNLSEARRIFASRPIDSIWKADVLHYFLVYLEPAGMRPLENLINKRTVAQAVSVSKAKMQLEGWTGTGKELGIFLGLLLLLLGGLSVASMMVTRFEAMALQLAVLRAIGYERSQIRSWLLWEGCLLGSSACFIGALLDRLAFPWIRLALGSALPPPEQIASPLWQSAPVWGMAIAATIGAVAIPLVRLYRQDVHFSLKG